MHFFNIHLISVLVFAVVCAATPVIQTPLTFDTTTSWQDSQGLFQIGEKRLHRVIRRAKYKLRRSGSNNTFELELSEDDTSKDKLQDDYQTGKRMAHNTKLNSSALRNSLGTDVHLKIKATPKPTRGEKYLSIKNDNEYSDEFLPHPANDKDIHKKSETNSSLEEPSTANEEETAASNQPFETIENSISKPLAEKTKTFIPLNENVPLSLETLSTSESEAANKGHLLTETVNEGQLSPLNRAIIEDPLLTPDLVSEGPLSGAEAITDEPVSARETITDGPSSVLINKVKNQDPQQFDDPAQQESLTMNDQ